MTNQACSTATARADQGHASASAPRGRPWAGIRPCLAWPPAVGTMQRVERLARHLVQPGATSRLPLAAAAQTSGTHSRQPIFKPEVLAAFDTESYYRDGYWVFPSVMTDAARESWLVALKESDDINNELTKQVDWREDVDWESIGHPPPTPEEIEGLMTRGGFNTKYWIPDRWWFDREMSGTVGRRIPFKPGRRPPSMPSPYVPANVAMEYHPFLLNVLTHPQMLELHQRILRSTEIRFDHCSLLVRKPGFSGQATHSHAYTIPELERDEMGMQLVRTLAYPEGFGEDREGGLTLVDGSHLFNNGHLSLAWGDFEPPIRGTSNFESWAAEVGGVHPRTAEPLQFKTLSLPPGSMCSVALYTLHGVAPVAERTRYGSLFAFRAAGEPSISRWCSEEFTERAESGEFGDQCRGVFTV